MTRFEHENVVVADHVRLLSLVDVFEPLSREEIEQINWQNLNTKVGAGEVFYKHRPAGRSPVLGVVGHRRLGTAGWALLD